MFTSSRMFTQTYNFFLMDLAFPGVKSLFDQLDVEEIPTPFYIAIDNNDDKHTLSHSTRQTVITWLKNAINTTRSQQVSNNV